MDMQCAMQYTQGGGKKLLERGEKFVRRAKEVHNIHVHVYVYIQHIHCTCAMYYLNCLSSSFGRAAHLECMRRGFKSRLTAAV